MAAFYVSATPVTGLVVHHSGGHNPEAKSYSERLFDFSRIEHLEPGLAEEALLAPARAESVDWEPAAAALVLREASGYPYFIQQFGQDTWNEATGPGIDLTDARVGVVSGRATLDSGFFRARWDRATRGEQQYLRAMAVDGDAGSSSGEVATRLGKRNSSLGPVRAKLIEKGLVYAPEHGVVAFTVPGMAAFIARQPEA
ncbi:hypothetical protein [Kineococcus rhizosphaerae]|uniref:hypothetical protein n=1 Tax=Kineococcus rhizosphaerae TaxID=559628 RepID=UPI000D06F679|nr:hypothetical protein [Kineococcus rhizosphaerae]